MTFKIRQPPDSFYGSVSVGFQDPEMGFIGVRIDVDGREELSEGITVIRRNASGYPLEFTYQEPAHYRDREPKP